MFQVKVYHRPKKKFTILKMVAQADFLGLITYLRPGVESELPLFP